jgi:hypothetical protein
MLLFRVCLLSLNFGLFLLHSSSACSLLLGDHDEKYSYRQQILGLAQPQQEILKSSLLLGR